MMAKTTVAIIPSALGDAFTMAMKPAMAAASTAQCLAFLIIRNSRKLTVSTLKWSWPMQSLQNSARQFRASTSTRFGGVILKPSLSGQGFLLSSMPGLMLP